MESRVEGDNLRVMPNATKQAALPVTDAALARTPGKGIAIARLSSNKQISHALQSLAKVQTDPSPVLQIYGDGDQRASLESLCADLVLNERTTFKGHVPGVQEAL